MALDPTLTVEQALQMVDAQADGFSAGEWCYAANVLGQEVERLRTFGRRQAKRIPRCEGRTRGGYRCAQGTGHDGAHSHPNDPSRAQGSHEKPKSDRG